MGKTGKTQGQVLIFKRLAKPALKKSAKDPLSAASQAEPNSEVSPPLGRHPLTDDERTFAGYMAGPFG
jgi:hypothetical protein